MQIAYDFTARRIMVTDRRQNACLYDHNQQGEVTAITDPTALTTLEYSYDCLVTRQVNPLGGVIENVYETAESHPDVTSSVVYDPASNVTNSTDPRNFTTLSQYDAAARLSHRTDPVGNVVETTYDAASNDGLDRRSQISSPGGTVAEYAYRGPYLLAKKLLFGAASILALQGDLTYDATRRLVRDQSVRASAGVTIFDESLAWYDRNLKSASTRADLEGRQLAYTYDGADRMVDVERTVAVTQCEQGLPKRWSYNYDTADNLLARTEERETCQSQRIVDLPLDGSGRNRPGAVDGEPLTWDASGNLTSKGDVTLEYDYRNRLIRAQAPGGPYDYVYDHFNRRVRKTGGGTVEKTVWSGWQAIETYVDDQLTERRTFGPGMDEIVRIEKIGSSATYLPIYDSTGNLVLVTDETGKPVERYEYSPFGERFIFADTSPPEIEQVRLNNGEVWLEISEYVDGDALQQKVLSGLLRLTDLDAGADLPITVTQPITTGRQAGRRIVIATVPAPLEGTNVELVIPGAALVDSGGRPATGDYTQAFQWVATDFVVDDTVAPRLDTICVQGDHLEIQFSEEPDLAQIDQALQVDGGPQIWTLGADRYTVVSGPLAAASHTMSVLGGGVLDLAGLALPTNLTRDFEISSPTPENVVLFDSPREGELASSAIGLVYGFHGRPVDLETGLMYFRNRYYDPDLGRFLSTDPMGYGDGPSLYQFAGYSPSNFGDPTGEFIVAAAAFMTAVGIWGATEEIERATDIDPHAHLGIAGAVGGTRAMAIAGFAIATAGFGGGLATGLGGGLIAEGATAGAFAGAGGVLAEDLIDVGILHRRENFSSFGRYAGSTAFGSMLGGAGGAVLVRFPRLGAPVFPGRVSAQTLTRQRVLENIAHSRAARMSRAVARGRVSNSLSRSGVRSEIPRGPLKNASGKLDDAARAARTQPHGSNTLIKQRLPRNLAEQLAKNSSPLCSKSEYGGGWRLQI